MRVLAACLLALTAVAGAPQNSDARAREIVSRMTLDEKLSELHGLRDATHNRFVPGIPRLGIPQLQITNGPAGAGADGAGPQPKATALPAPISLAATWDRALAAIYGLIVGSECRLLGNGLVEGPTINIARVPQNGRTFEGFGEDPYLTGEIAAAEIAGIQSQHVVADVKHYDANNQETDRRTIDEQIGERALREIYLPAFEAAVKEGNAGAVMCAYPRVNGTYCCEHAQLMNEILKKEWGFTGFITSDFHATHSSTQSALAGLDLEMPGGDYFGGRLKKDIEAGKVPISVIDDKLVRRFRTMMETGVWDDVPARGALPEKEHGAIARQLAEAGIVLLRNDGLLPLKVQALQSIALIGPWARKASTGGGGSSHVLPLYTVDPASAIARRLSPKSKIAVLDGLDIPAAVAAAAAANAAIVFAGDVDREGHDQSLALGGNQNALIAAVAAANPRTIVVLETGSAVVMPWIDGVPALLEAWYPGEESGNAIADVLFGDVNPSGKLPITFPKRVEDTFAADRTQYPGIHGIVDYKEGIDVGYRHDDQDNIEPLFPFGFGLSYTTFTFSNLRVGGQTIDFDVTNSGKVAGSEVAQVYVTMPPVAGEPPKQLRAFQKVTLDPGKSAHVRLTLGDRAFQIWDVVSHAWKTVPGTYGIHVGSSSRDLPLQADTKIQ